MLPAADFDYQLWPLFGHSRKVIAIRIIQKPSQVIKRNGRNQAQLARGCPLPRQDIGGEGNFERMDAVSI